MLLQEQMIRSRHALTLIELLVAMGIAVLLAAVVFAIYAGVLRTLDSQSRWRSAAYPVAAAFDTLSLDLADAVIPWGITNSPFVLAPSQDGAEGIKLHFFTTMPVSAAPQSTTPERDMRAYAIREMDYAMSASNAVGTNGAPDASSGLIRSWQAFRTSEAGGIASNRDIFGCVRAIRLEVFDGKSWTNTWGGGTNATLPQAARVMLAVGDAPVSWRTAEVLIPAGHRIAAPKRQVLKNN